MALNKSPRPTLCHHVPGLSWERSLASCGSADRANKPAESRLSTGFISALDNQGSYAKRTQAEGDHAED